MQGLNEWSSEQDSTQSVCNENESESTYNFFKEDNKEFTSQTRFEQVKTG